MAAIYQRIYDAVTETDLMTGKPKESPEMQLAVLKEVLKRNEKLKSGTLNRSIIVSDIRSKVQELEEQLKK